MKSYIKMMDFFASELWFNQIVAVSPLEYCARIFFDLIQFDICIEFNKSRYNIEHGFFGWIKVKQSDSP